MIKAHILSIFSFRSYQLFAYAKKWQIFWFLLYILLLGSLIFSFYSNHLINSNLSLFIKNFPEVTFNSGKLTSPDLPVEAKIPHTGFSIRFDPGMKTPPAQQDFINKKVFMFVSKDQFFFPSGSGVDARPIPTQLNFTTTQQFLDKNKDNFKNFLSAMAFLTSFVVTGMLMIFGFCLAGSIGLFMRLFKRQIPMGAVLRWAVFLQGPLLLLWLINLFFPIPLYSFAMFIVCMIYMQQIFNLYGDQPFPSR